ncbi:MAG: TlpA family protein disulfide reductase [Acidobacteriota bacterium]
MLRARSVIFALIFITATLAWVLAAPPAPDGQDRVSQLQSQVQALTRRIIALEREVARLKKRGAGSPVDQAKEAEAAAAFKPIRQLLTDGRVEEARPQLASFREKYAATRAGKQAAVLLREVAVVGKQAPADWRIQKWFQGEGEIDLAHSTGPTLLVFWESWCPHCRREVPKLQSLYVKYHHEGLQVVGLTQVNRGATEKSVTDFVAQNKIEYPIAREDGSLSVHFGVRGIPAVAVVKDGKVVWRGHPARVTDKLVNLWLNHPA